MGIYASPQYNNFLFDHVVSGCVWSGDSYGSTRAASMTAGVVCINGVFISVAAVSARTFTASRDVYVDIDSTGTLVYTDNTTNAASPALAANSIRIAIIVVGASSIANAAAVNQGEETKVLPIASSIPYQVTDSLGNLICPRDPLRKVLGYRQILADQGSITTEVAVTGLSCPVIVPANRKIKLKVFMNSSNATADAYNVAIIKESSTTLQQAYANSRSGSVYEFLEPELLLTPSTGSHTYSVTAIGNVTGSGTMTVRAGATLPAFIKVELA